MFILRIFFWFFYLEFVCFDNDFCVDYILVGNVFVMIMVNCVGDLLNCFEYFCDCGINRIFILVFIEK